jgi:hypothetical protein
VSLGRIAWRILATLLLAGFIHLDWHVARPAHQHLSLGWTHHWLLAVPVFALLAWQIHRTVPESAFGTSAAIVVGGAFLAQVVEPAGELLFGAPLSWAFGTERLRAFEVYLGSGIAAHMSTLMWLRMRDRKSESAAD